MEGVDGNENVVQLEDEFYDLSIIIIKIFLFTILKYFLHFFK